MIFSFIVVGCFSLVEGFKLLFKWFLNLFIFFCEIKKIVYCILELFVCIMVEYKVV